MPRMAEFGDALRCVIAFLRGLAEGPEEFDLRFCGPLRGRSSLLCRRADTSDLAGGLLGALNSDLEI